MTCSIPPPPLQKKSWCQPRKHNHDESQIQEAVARILEGESDTFASGWTAAPTREEKKRQREKKREEEEAERLAIEERAREKARQERLAAKGKAKGAAASQKDAKGPKGKGKDADQKGKGKGDGDRPQAAKKDGKDGKARGKGNEKRDGKKERLPSWYNDEAVDDMWDSPEQGEMWDFPDPEEAKAQMAAVDVVVYSTQGASAGQAGRPNFRRLVLVCIDADFSN